MTSSLSATQTRMPFHVDELPEEFYCPISGEIMTDPVTIDADPTHQSFERSEIRRWFQCCVGTKRAPTTNEPLASTALSSNNALRAQIFNRVHGAPADTYAPSAPRGPSPVEGPIVYPACPALGAFDQAAPSAPPLSAAGSAAPLSTAGSAPPLSFANAMPHAVGASAHDFKNVIALGRSRISQQLGKSETLAATMSAALGATGGLVGAGAVAAGVACGIGLAFCGAVAAGAALLAAGIGLGALLRRSRANAAKSQPDIARKLGVLHEMHSEFQALRQPTAAERAVLEEIKQAIDLIDNPRANWIKSLKWAGGAALIAVPMGILVGLGVARHYNDSLQKSKTDADQSTSAAQSFQPAAHKTPMFRPTPAYRAPPAPARHTYAMGLRDTDPNPFANIASTLLQWHQFGTSRVQGRRSATRQIADSGVRVPMKSSWLEALDRLSYMRVVDHASAA